MHVLPSLYISHGSPMTVLQPGLAGKRLADLSGVLPRPRAIVIASAHWLTYQPQVGGAAQPETLHDFSGFPQALYARQYPAPGDVVLAGRVRELIADAGFPVTVDTAHGLDHGIWVPLCLLYPDADIPVIPVSIQPHLGPAHQLALGRALAPLRSDGVLVIGSGSITHNLHDWRMGHDDEEEAPYVRPFTEWIEHKLNDNDIAALLDYRQQAPFAARAHPTDEHLLPLYFAMGAAGSDCLGAHRIDAGIEMGFLAMDIYRFNGAGSVCQTIV